jgi:hypothetical protein
MSDLQKYILQGEHLQQDFKFAIDNQKKIARTIAAFANTEGGRLLIGVKDNGKIAGCNPEEEFYMIQGAAEMYVQPAVIFESKVHQEGHKLVLEIIIPIGLKKVHQAKDEEDHWRYYFRIADHTLRANKIVQKVWRYENSPVARPEVFEENALRIVQSIGEKPITLSQIYRLSGVAMKIVDHWLPLFICWDLVKTSFVEPSFLYSLKED